MPLREGLVFAESLSRVRVQRRRVAGEVGLENVDRAVAIVVAERDAHACLRLAVLAVRAARLHRDVLEGPVAVVPIERARVRVVRHVQIRPAIIVEVEGADAEAVRPCGLGDARRLGHVGEAAAAGVAVQHVLAAGESGRTAGHHRALVPAQSRLRHRCGLQIEVDVVGGKQIEEAVAVVIHERAARAPACAGDEPRAGGDVFERAVAAVPEQTVLTPESHEQIGEAVVVVVSCARPLSPADERKARLCGHVFEGAVRAVAIQVTRGLPALREPFERGAVDEEQIEEAVVVVIEHRHAAAGRLEQVLVRALTAIGGRGGETSRARDVGERESQRDRRLRGRDGGQPEEQRHDHGLPTHQRGSGKRMWGASLRASARCAMAASRRPTEVNAFASA